MRVNLRIFIHLTLWDTATAATHMILASSLEKRISHYKDCGYHGYFKLGDHHLLKVKLTDAIWLQTKRSTQIQPSCSVTVKPGIWVSQRPLKCVTSSGSDLHNGETESRWQSGRGWQGGGYCCLQGLCRNLKLLSCRYTPNPCRVSHPKTKHLNVGSDTVKL